MSVIVNSTCVTAKCSINTVKLTGKCYILPVISYSKYNISASQCQTLLYPIELYSGVLYALKVIWIGCVGLGPQILGSLLLVAV